MAEYVHVTDGRIDSGPDGPPGAVLVDGRWQSTTPELLLAAGWVPVPDRPPDTDTDTHVLGVVDGVVVWLPRPLDAVEQVERRRLAQRADLAELAVARAGLTANKAWLERAAAPTVAQIVQHLDRLTRQVSALIRLTIGDVHPELLDPEEGAA